MSFDGQVLCQRMLIGPWALTTLGAVTAAAPAPAASIKRRRVVILDASDFSLDMENPPSFFGGFAPAALIINRRTLVGIPAAMP